MNNDRKFHVKTAPIIYAKDEGSPDEYPFISLDFQYRNLLATWIRELVAHNREALTCKAITDGRRIGIYGYSIPPTEQIKKKHLRLRPLTKRVDANQIVNNAWEVTATDFNHATRLTTNRERTPSND